MNPEKILLEKAAAALAGVERDTNYGLHMSDYFLPYGETRIELSKDYPTCECTLCSIRKYLAENGQE